MAISRKGLERLRAAALHGGTVGNIASNRRSVHAAYRYPARFSPVFAGAAIEAFSSPGDTVVDPFCGGGTTGIEATLRARHVFSSDLSPLAVFLARAKGTEYRLKDYSAVEEWADDCLNISYLSLTRDSHLVEDGRMSLGALEGPEYRYVLAALSGWERQLRDLTFGQDLARLALLRCGQRTLDLRREIPTLDALRDTLLATVNHTISASLIFSKELREVWASQKSRRSYKCRELPVHKIDSRQGLGRRKAQLAVFSPPYPGIHVLYPRWQLLGRKESAAPFWLAGVSGDTNETTYTMGRRGVERTDEFVAMYSNGLRSLATVLDPGAFMVQMIGFKDPSHQLPQVLRSIRHAGFQEVRFKSLATASDGRLWRTVPSQRWYNAVREGPTPGSKEVVLVHRLDG